MRAPPGPVQHPGRVVAAVALGVVVGALAGALTYEWLAPVLERRTDWLRETQGLVWNLVPVLAVVGGAVAYTFARRRRW